MIQKIPRIAGKLQFMGIVIRQGIKNAVVSYIGIGLGFLTTVLLYPKILSPEEYGLTRVLTAFVGLASQLAALGSINALLKFFPVFRDEESGHRGAFVYALGIPVVGFLFCWLVISIFFPAITGLYVEKSALFLDYFYLSIPLIGLFLAFDVAAGYARAQYDTVFSALLTDVGIRTGVIVLLGAVAAGWLHFGQFMLGFALLYALRTLFQLVWTFVKHPVSWNPEPFPGRPPLLEMLSFCGYSFFSGVSVFMVNNIDVLMIGHYAGLGATAVYSLAFYVTSVISVPQNALARIGVPLISQAFQENKPEVVADLYKRSALNQSLSGGIIFLLIWGGIDALFQFLPAEYGAGKYIILIVGLARWFDLSTGLNAGILLTSPWFKFDLVANILLVILAVATNWLLIPPLGIFGAALATAISIVLFNALRVWYVWYRLQMQPFSKALFINALLILTPIIGVGFLPPIFPWAFERILVSTLAVAGIGWAVHRLNTAPEVSTLLINLVNRFYRR